MDFPESVKLEAKERAHYCCVFCQGVVFLEVHHIRPAAAGGSDDLDNAVPLCPNHHTVYGHNPTMEKFVREARDFWWDYCARRAAHPDTITLGQRIDQLQKEIAEGHRELLADLKTTFANQFQIAAAAVRSARTVDEVARAASTVSLQGVVRGSGPRLIGTLSVRPPTDEPR